MRTDDTATQSAPLHGARILVVEDDFLVRLEIETVLGQAGARVRACGTVADALAYVDAEALDAAVLDVRLGRETVAPVAHKLTDLGTPFVLYTGQVASDISTSQWPQAPIVAKPASPTVLLNAVIERMRQPVAQRSRDR